jgi:hypothetical protein
LASLIFSHFTQLAFTFLGQQIKIFILIKLHIETYRNQLVKEFIKNMRMKKVGRPVKDLAFSFRAKAWFNVVAKLGEGCESVFSDSNIQLSANDISKRIGISAYESRLASKWQRGDFCPTLTNRKLLYIELGWIRNKGSTENSCWRGHEILNQNAMAAAEITLFGGPDGSNLWEVLNESSNIDSIDAVARFVNPLMENLSSYSDLNRVAYASQLALPLLSCLISRSKAEYKKKKFDYDFFPMLLEIESANESVPTQERGAQPSPVIVLNNILERDCRLRLEWYGATLEQVLSLANLSLN